MKRVLTRAVVARASERHTIVGRGLVRRPIALLIGSMLEKVNFELVRVSASGPDDYLESSHIAQGRGEDAETMIGMRQLDNMQACVTKVLDEGIPGDLLEAGVWRGGMTIFMRAILKARGESGRRVWVADSFQGLPRPGEGQDSFGWRAGDMAESLDSVRENFARYGLLDDQVAFIQGYFGQSLPTAPVRELSILRVDADLYESTRDVLINLYPKLSSGGFAIFDDYLNLQDCRRAVDEYRSEHGIDEKVVPIDARAVCWQKR